MSANKYSASDRKDSAGNWVAAFRVNEGGVSVQYHTRAGFLWHDLSKRTKPGGRSQRLQPTYSGCSNGFSSFHDFADWAISQPGYSDIDYLGNRYQLDKDILSTGSKVYSRETCCFVPARINSLLNVNGSLRNLLPIGVSYDAATRKYRGRAKHLGRTVGLGTFSTPIEAHKAWQQFKSDRISDEISLYAKTVSFRSDVACALMGKVWRIRTERSVGALTEAI